MSIIMSTLIDDHDAGTNRDNAWHVVKGHYPALLPFLLFLTAESFDLMWNVPQVHSEAHKSLFCLAHIWYFILIKGFTNIY